MLYLDYAATSPVHPEVIDTISTVMKRHYGNPSSLHRLGMEAEHLLKQARQVIASRLFCQPEELIFTSGGTEGNNLALLGTALQYQNRGKHIITVQTEHASVYEAAVHLEKSGFEVTYLPVDRQGRVTAQDVLAAVREDTILVSVMHVNNETGAIQPVEEIGKRLKRYPKVLFHVDAVQSIGKLPVNLHALEADLVTGSAHKIRGPKGAGFLFKRHGIALYPLQHGGDQELGSRPGTENVPLIVGMAKAVRIAIDAQACSADKMYSLRRLLMRGLAGIEEVVLTGCTEESIAETWQAPHIVHVTCPGFKAETIIHALEKHEIYISARSACSSRQQKPSRVLLAMGMGHEQAESGLRISFSAEHSEEQLISFIDCLQQILQKLRKA
ncbi:cysteine desulfurase family protein [Paenibacillus senegalensis]|uniref:cysteine desulfurase family protein n=1 Tax=Paenibacillus senegalensis TaxID=1465766 RepID=UPI000288D912|nr:cysteine desulfurase family protein [Paenibacillus senegalensis]